MKMGRIYSGFPFCLPFRMRGRDWLLAFLGANAILRSAVEKVNRRRGRRGGGKGERYVHLPPLLRVRFPPPRRKQRPSSRHYRRERGVAAGIGRRRRLRRGHPSASIVVEPMPICLLGERGRAEIFTSKIDTFSVVICAGNAPSLLAPFSRP